MSKPTTSAPANISPRPMVPSPQNKSYITGARPCVAQNTFTYRSQCCISSSAMRPSSSNSGVAASKLLRWVPKRASQFASCWPSYCNVSGRASSALRCTKRWAGSDLSSSGRREFSITQLPSPFHRQLKQPDAHRVVRFVLQYMHSQPPKSIELQPLALARTDTPFSVHACRQRPRCQRGHQEY
eukprot:1791382-Pleurochrysis_carterae.AAC.1